MNNLIKQDMKKNYSHVEIWGAEKLFNHAFDNEYGYEINESFFVCDGLINSESDANGYPVEIEGYKLSHLNILNNGLLVATCYDEDENEHIFRVEPSNITELTI